MCIYICINIYIYAGEKRLGLQIPARAMVCAQLSGGAHRCRFESLRKYEIKSLLCVASLA